MPNDDAGPSTHLAGTADHDSVELYELAPLPLVSVGADGAIRSANFATAALLRQERDSLIDRQLSSFVHEGDRRLLHEQLRSQRHAARRVCELRLTLPNGSLLPVQLLARASWRTPGVDLLTLLDLRERELDAWEKQQLRQAAVKARSANYTKERLIARLCQELRALGNLQDPATERGGLGLGLSLVKTLIKERTKDWNPKMADDPVQARLLDIIAAKKKGRKRPAKAKTPPPTAGNVINIMDALRKSIKAEGKGK